MRMNKRTLKKYFYKFIVILIVIAMILTGFVVILSN